MINIINIAKNIEKIGGKLYLVGGAVRDELLGKEVKDKDYCVTGITKEQFLKLFPSAIIKGKSFEVFDLYGNEFSMARREEKNGKGHKEFKIDINPEIKIEEDLERRDITINSIAKEVLTGKIIDIFNGIEDINNKIIRATTKRFTEDPLRVYRVARFAASLGFLVHEDTIKMMNILKHELKYLPKERVFMEFSKALAANKPSIFFNILKEANVLEVHFKELYNLIGALQPVEHHPEGDSYNHTMMVVDKCAEFTNNLEIRFASLVHDLGKGTTPKEEYPHHYGHEQRGAELVTEFCNNIKAPKLWEKCGKTACIEHMRGGIFYKMKSTKKVDFIERVAKSPLRLNGLQIIVFADKLSNRKIEKENIEFETIGRQCLLEINGTYIKYKYGPLQKEKFGRKLHEERVKWMIEKTKK